MGGDVSGRGADLIAPVRTVNAQGRGPFVIVADHASNRIPPQWGDLGLSAADRVRHIAWDPGSLPVSMRLTELLDAPLIHPTVSRLLIDCNRDLDAPDLIPAMSEITEIPGNRNVGPDDRDARIAASHAPFHAAIDRVLDARQAAGLATILVCMHSFTPVYKGKQRPWPIGLIHARNGQYTAALRDALAADAPELNIGWNEPYSALNGVTYTLEHHGDGRALEATMIEVRHDEILEPAGVELWSQRLARALTAAAEAISMSRRNPPAARTGRMPRIVRLFVHYVDTFNLWVGRFAMQLLFVMGAVLLWSTLSRLFLNAPVNWALEMSQFLLSAYYLLGGPYTLQKGGHVRMDLLYGRLSPKQRAVTDAITILFVIFFLGVLLYGGLSSTNYAIQYGQKNYSAWSPPLWPIKSVMTFGVVLMLLQAISSFFKDLAEALGKPIA